MDGEEPDIKPKITVFIQNDRGEKVTVAAKRDTKFAKLFTAAEKKWGKEPGTYKFTYDGQRLRGDQTLADVDMEHEDTIDANLEQVGGMS